MKHAAFVLVAGGLGERLGYDGIKLQIPIELTTGVRFAQLQCPLAVFDPVTQCLRHCVAQSICASGTVLPRVAFSIAFSAHHSSCS